MNISDIKKEYQFLKLQEGIELFETFEDFEASSFNSMFHKYADFVISLKLPYEIYKSKNTIIHQIKSLNLKNCGQFLSLGKILTIKKTGVGFLSCIQVGGKNVEYFGQDLSLSLLNLFIHVSLLDLQAHTQKEKNESYIH